MLALLENTIDKINTLKIFFDEETEAIEDKSVEGMRSNISEFFVNAYLQALMSDDESTFAQPLFKATEEIAEMHIEDIQIINGDDGKKCVTFKKKEGSTLKDIQRCSRYFRMFSHMNQIHYENAIVMLITKFEEFIAEYFEFLFSIFPDLYINDEKISYMETIGLTSIQIKEKIIQNKVDELLRQSYVDWFKMMKRHGIEIPSTVEKALIELYARRNIIVHNSCVVNRYYLSSVSDSTYKIGDQALMDEEYVENAFTTIKQAVFSILIESIKIINGDKTESTDVIFSESFDELEKGNYNVALIAYKLLSENKCVDTKTKTMAAFNYWISKKQLSGLESIISEVNAYDVSVMEKIFVMAKFILLEDYIPAERYINELFNAKELTSYEIEKWPLFIDYRKTEYYSKFKELHLEDFAFLTIEQGKNTEDISTEITDADLIDMEN